MVSVEPTCTSVGRTGSDEFIVLACDGIWDVMTSEDTVSFVQETLYHEMSTKPRRNASGDKSSKTPHAVLALEQTCTKLIGTCLAKGSSDNMTVVVIIPVPTTPPSSPSPSPPAPLSDAETAAIIAEETVTAAVEIGLTVAQSTVSPERPRLQRALTITPGSVDADELQRIVNQRTNSAA